MRNKYDQAQDQDMPIVERVLEVAEHHGVPMAQVALAWHWAKGVTAPIVGCLQPERVDDAIAALGVQHHELSSTRSKTYANIAGLLRTN
ncbi:aldo/keto reductase [Bifidobacterium pseudocatenulatum]|jgi:aryl-alcohol dehydrogenase-like predicted oxidoreductase|uniref:aldo/keto reductase n=1 Tax=Bifidobacterium pseudocatenulatum TaxID=28026 RepID=UPI000E4CB64F|nr:aldo/keto reductase [Bifidobacterium pseudocatenulatum]MDB6518332.1 aldo/keto reductase [Bifidobacterium pseudocatenulatum]MDB6525358.1 aldo/keto reductase [Bifidobacterium pseudocatenulatum]MDB6527668.1 aldo/keto reductase [Bifidobacterium pseudocatenulatum]MDB6529350.1 aldo/keto reductase [Bifidobacterium pseudocatenulatum]MDB6531187.1 aldo/keto reductase [Bifidobacterium pseudocatenulatum]